MSNPLFNVLGGAVNGNNPLAMLMQLKSNPLAFLQKAGFNVPSNINDPTAIIQHLMNSGQLSQQQYNQAQQMAQSWGLK